MIEKPIWPQKEKGQDEMHKYIAVASLLPSLFPHPHPHRATPWSPLLQFFGEAKDALWVGYILVGGEIVIAIFFVLFIVILSERLKVNFYLSTIDYLSIRPPDPPIHLCRLALHRYYGDDDFLFFIIFRTK